MNRIYIILIIILSFSCKAQNDSITTNLGTINSLNVFKASSDFLTENFGEPENIEEYFYEMENTQGSIYHYSGLLFYVVNNTVEGFEISTNEYVFTANNVKVGNNIDTLEFIYPNSYSNKSDGNLIILFSNADYYISVYYDLNNIINKISLNVF